jgi:UDP-glucose 4-epimerase
MKREKILIVGGAGYIGSHVNKLLNTYNLSTLVFDNLSTGNKESVKWGDLILGDLSNKNSLDALFKNNDISSVLHFAASAYVGESVLDPEKYYINNVVNTINLLQAMKNHGVFNIVFSSSCAVYGTPQKLPISENMSKNPMSPYGRTKAIVEDILEDYSKAYGINFVALRYFNAAGADSALEIGECHSPETHLIPNVIYTSLGIAPYFTLHGKDYNTFDGSCIRDFIHVEDLAEAHYLALTYLENNMPSISVNLGTGQGHSILEIVHAVEKISGTKINIKIDSRRFGDPPELFADAKLARSILGWKPKYTLIDDIIKTAWDWHFFKHRK